MDRRELFGFLGVGAAGLFAAGLGEAQGQEKDKEQEKRDEHLKVLGQSVRRCNEAARHCLDLLAKESTSHREYHARAHELTMDCQSFCVLTATLMIRNSPLAR